MSATTTELSNGFAQSALEELHAAYDKIKHCLRQLNDEQIWWRPAEGMNSIANLLLHLSGNVRQWIISGVGGTPDMRQRQAEFDDRSQTSKADLLAQLDATLDEAAQTIKAVSPEELLRRRDVQGFQVSGFDAIFGSVSHFRGHSQEIVGMTRQQIGDQYQFDFVPQSK